MAASLGKPVLRGGRVVLRPLNGADAETIFAALNDEEVNRLTGTQAAFTLEQVRAHYMQAENADDRVDYAVTLGEQPDTLLGEVVLNDIDWRNRSANFRIVLFDKASFGKGYGTQATQLILEYGFETLDLHRIDLEVFAFNPRAIRVYEKIGFVREGVKRDVLLWDGDYHDAVVMSLLQHEYAERASQAAR